MVFRRFAVFAFACLWAACARPRRESPLSYDAYVWQRTWPVALSMGVASPPAELSALRILAREVSGPGSRSENTNVDRSAMVQSGLEIVAVMRIHGVPSLDGISLAPLLSAAREWRQAGVKVRGIEIDHDCPTAKLSDYADWLAREKNSVGDLALSITALPTWKASPDLSRLLDLVELAVVQVHAIAAPILFDPATARKYLVDWARVSRRPFRVALPTYQVRLATGEELSTDPMSVAALLRDLASRPIPGLVGVSWFRLGHASDPRAFSPSTLSALARGELPTASLAIRLRPVVPGSHDIALENTGSFDTVAPTTVRVDGKIEHLEGVGGYRPVGRELRAPNPVLVRAGQTLVVGFALGKELALAP